MKKEDVNKKYKVTRISLDGNKDSDFGVLTGAELKSVLKGFHFEDVIPGDGMWFKTGLKYGFDVKMI